MASKAQDLGMDNSNRFHFSTTEYYSTLQVVPQARIPRPWIDRSLEEKEPLPESGLEPVRPPLFSDLSDAPELSPHSETVRTHNSPTASSIEPDASLAHSFGTLLTDKKGSAEWKRGRTICGIPRKTFWILSVVKIIMTIVVIAVPVGLVFGRGKTSSAHANASHVSPSNPAAISNTSSLASIAWNDTNGIMQYRVYWQGEDNIIRESAWNGTASLWRVSNSAIGSAKPKTPLVAVVNNSAVNQYVSGQSPRGLDKGSSLQQINLNAISAGNSIVTWLCTDPDVADGETTFTTGPLITPTIGPASDTALAAAWDRAPGCIGCSENLLLVYQDNAGQLALGNLTVDGWLWSTLFANPVPGTGLALDVRLMGNVTRNIAVYYQLGNDYLTATTFNGSSE